MVPQIPSLILLLLLPHTQTYTEGEDDDRGAEEKRSGEKA